MLSFTSPVAGLALTGFTAPTFTIAEEVATTAYKRSWIVTSLGGTQPGVRAHSASDPFRVTLTRPANFSAPPLVNPATYVLNGKPQMNVFNLKIEKGMYTTGGASSGSWVGVFDANYKLVAGADVNDVPNIKGMLSFLGGLLGLVANVNSIHDSFIQGSL